MDVSYPLSYFNEKLQWIHTDVKPENILVEFEGSVPNFYLADLSCSLTVKEYKQNTIAGTAVWVCYMLSFL